MSNFWAELLGTAMLIVLGNGVVANVLLAKTKGNGGGWIVIAFGWGMAVFVAAFCVDQYSGAHLNPALTIGLAAAGKFKAHLVPMYLLAQMIGAMAGAVIVFVFYNEHFRITDDPALKLACFCTSPNIRSIPTAVFCETVGTFMLVLPIFLAPKPTVEYQTLADSAPVSLKLGLGAIGPLHVGLLVLGIGLSLGGTTGYAINPARDLGPRLVHAILPIPNKGKSDWGYAWVPVVGPCLGALLASLVSLAVTAP